MRQLNLSHLALRKGLNTFAHTKKLFVVRPPVAGLAPRKSRSRTVDLRSDRPAGVYETIRHGRDALSYILIAGAGIRQRLPLISKTRYVL